MAFFLCEGLRLLAFAGDRQGLGGWPRGASQDLGGPPPLLWLPGRRREALIFGSVSLLGVRVTP